MTEQTERVKGRDFWKACSTCKKEIPFGSVYYLCDVSTCRNPRVGLVFCSPLCWDGHLGIMRHRSASCEEETAPNR